MPSRNLSALACAILILGVSSSARAAISLSVATSLPSPQPVGTPVTFTGTVTGATGTPSFLFEIATGSSGSFGLVRDYSKVNAMPWTTIQQGAYQIRVTAVDPASGSRAQMIVPFNFASRVTGGVAVVSATQHPLVALFSAPACANGQVYVQFKTATDANWKTTNTLNCQAAVSLNFYVAGMRPSTAYSLQEIGNHNGKVYKGPIIPFTTGALPFNYPAPSIFHPVDAQTSITDNVLLTTFLSLLTPPLSCAIAVDLTGTPIWYEPDVCVPPQVPSYLVRPADGGTFLAFINQQILREEDLAGNLVRETNTTELNSELVAQGQMPMNNLNHEALRIPNGHTLIIGSVEKILVNEQGPGPVDVLGDEIVDLDQNFKPVWVWNAFNYLPNNRIAPLDEKCYQNGTGCPPIHLASVANDWTHANAIYYRTDGNILFSMRDQDWVIKINYQNGAGDGSILWYMGNQGSFAVNSPDSYPWFTHQHSIEMQGGNIEVFDNGNTRIAAQGSGNSRGMVFSVDEANLIATTLLSSDLGDYAYVFGSAQLLSNGNYFFMAGVNGSAPKGPSFAEEWIPGNGVSGTQDFSLNQQATAYRAWRMTSLYHYTF